MLLLKDEEWAGWSNHEIARHCRVDSSTVDRIRAPLPQNGSEKAPVKFTNKHGQTAPMNIENIGKRDTGCA